MDKQSGTNSAGLQARLEHGLGHFRRSLLGKAFLLALLGLCVLVWPGSSLRMLVQLVGAFCLIDGIAGVFMALRAPEGRFFLGEAIVSLVIGAVLLFWPGSAEVVLMLFGAWILYSGVRNVLYSGQLPQAAPERDALRSIGIVACIVGLVLLLWPEAGVTTIAWLIGLSALLVAGLLAFVASRLQRVKTRVTKIDPKG